MENFTLSPETLVVGLIAFAAIFFGPRIRRFALGVIKGSPAGGQFILPGQLKAMIDSGKPLTILDVRNPDEYVGPLGHIAESGNLPLPEIESRIREIGEALADNKNDTLVIVCRTHNRSPKAAALFRKAGFSDIKVLKGGLVQWNAENHPVEGVAEPEPEPQA